MPKPSLAELIAAQAAGTPKSRRRRSAPPPVDAAKGEAVKQAPALADKRPAELVRALLVGRFITAYLKHNLNAAAALRAVRPDAPKKNSRQLAYELLQSEDVRMELHRQLRALSKHADLDEEWVRAHYRAIAEVSALDFVKIDKSGNITEFTLDPERLTPLQRRCIRGLRISPAGKVTGLDLPPLKEVVDSVARLNKLFGEVQDEAAGREFAQEIAQRMQEVARRLPPPLFTDDK